MDGRIAQIAVNQQDLPASIHGKGEGKTDRYGCLSLPRVGTGHTQDPRTLLVRNPKNLIAHTHEVVQDLLPEERRWNNPSFLSVWGGNFPLRGAKSAFPFHVIDFLAFSHYGFPCS
jgi:hypothetical protein